MLEGFDSDWSPLSDRNYATYSFIPPGSYTFKIISQNNDGHQSEAVEFSFVIVKPFWATTWFYTLVILVIIALILLLMRIRTIKIRKDRKTLETEVELRTQELESERKKVVDQKDIIEAKNTKITDSIFYARTIQESVLPDEEILSDYFNGHFIYYQPRDIVSGDFYWFKTRESRAVIVAADCTGHGVPGAFMSMLGSELLNQIVNSPEISSPAEMLKLLDEGVYNALHRNATGSSHDGMDIAICTFDTKTNVLIYSSASRPIVVQRKSKTTLYNATSCTVGSFKMQNALPNDQQLELKKGDRVYLFTDGYTDQFGSETGKKYTTKGFVRLIESLQNKTIENQKKAIIDEHLNWRHDEEQVDDILIMCFEV
jgi:serine phosphatase RsbU (regulator of sigma subunit)